MYYDDILGFYFSLYMIGHCLYILNKVLIN